MAQVGRDLEESVVTRWEQTDAPTKSMLKLTRTMVRLTWAVVFLTVLVLGAALHVGLR
jgi:NhaP-type Na+/H+ or K+/H+ antiporter